MAYHGQVYCPLNSETDCGYWVCFGGYLLPFIKAFKSHIRTDHSDLREQDKRDTGGIIDRWIGDTLVSYGDPVHLKEAI